MAANRPAAALDPRLFGKRGIVDCDIETAPASTLADDLRLFAATFAAGFLFVGVFIG